MLIWVFRHRRTARVKESHRKLLEGRITEANWSKLVPIFAVQIGKYKKDAGLDMIPVNDFSFYDQVLDMSALLGVIPSRYNFNGEEG